MDLLTNRLTDAQREELHKRIEVRKPEKPMSLFSGPHIPTIAPSLPVTKTQLGDVSSNHHYNPVGANIGLGTHYKSGCCGR